MLRFVSLAGCAAALLAAHVAPAHADVRGVFRIGVMPLDLEASRDTPLFGDDVDRAVRAYNVAAAAYDQRYGGTTEPIDAGDVGLSDTLLTFAPGFEAGGDVYFVRAEATVGVGDELRALGVGIYPLNLQAQFAPDVAAYISAGGSASWLDRSGSGDVGALVSLRAAGGVRVSERVVVEAGVGAFVIGGVLDLDEIEDYMPSANAPPPEPNTVVAAGEGSGVVDLSVGVVF